MKIQKITCSFDSGAKKKTSNSGKEYGENSIFTFLFVKHTLFAHLPLLIHFPVNFFITNCLTDIYIIEKQKCFPLKMFYTLEPNFLYFIVFICLGRQTKQIMVAKFQTLMLLLANAESSPFFKRLLPFICILTPKDSGEITV
jgi:hypothetical protein